MKKSKPQSKRAGKSRAKDSRAKFAQSAIAELGLNPDLYDATGMPIEWIAPASGAVMGGDPLGMAMADGIQVIGTPADMMSGKTPRMRELTLDDITDDCPVCVKNRERILAGDPPVALVFDP